MNINKEQLIEWLKSKALESAAFKEPYNKGKINGYREVLMEIETEKRFDKQ